MNGVYRRYRVELFPKLLKDPSVSPEDKRKISELLKKPWNPYLRRHVGLTEKSKILKENILKQYSGWSGRSQMHLKYLHYFGNESSESILEAYGLKPKAEEMDKMRSKACPNCSEPNKPDSKFCAKCRMVLSYDAYTETVEEKEQKQSEVKILKERYEKDMIDMDQKLNKIMSMMQQNPKLVNVKPESLKKKL